MRNINLIIDILKRYPHGTSRKKVFELSGQKTSTMLRSWNKARHEGIIKRLGYGVFVLSEKNITHFSGDASLSPQINVHALQLSFPIIADNTDDAFWDKINKGFKNSLVFYKYINKPIGLTIQKNSKQVTIQIYARNVNTPEDIESLAFRAGYFAYYYLQKNGLDIDLFNVQKKHLDIAIKDTILKTVIPEKNKVEVMLGRDAKPFFPADKGEPAEAHYDSSPIPSIETNDVTYAERYLRTPEMVTQILEIQNNFALNLKYHLETLNNINKAIEKLTKAVEELRK
jgi:hypothetical protein